MLLKGARDYVRYLMYKRRYPGARIAFGAAISSDTVLGQNVMIGAPACVGSAIVGDNVSIYSRNFLNRVHIGSYTYLAPGSQMDRVTIGQFCSIGPECMAGYGEHPTNWISTSPVFFSTRMQCRATFADCDHFPERSAISVGSDVWIGARAFIRDGIRIGDGAIVAAGAVVAKDVPSYAIVGGVPARIIRFRFSDDEIRQLLELRWWDWDEAELLSTSHLFRSPDIGEFLRVCQKKQSQNTVRT